jgi:hypothetical protein
MLVDTFIAALERYRGKQIYYQDAEGAFEPSEPSLEICNSVYKTSPEEFTDSLLIGGQGSLEELLRL